MTYKVQYKKNALKELSKMDKYAKLLIDKWIDKHLKDTTDPRQHGKALTGNKQGLWRYRVGDYRIVAQIIDDKVIILVITIKHRRNVYN